MLPLLSSTLARTLAFFALSAATVLSAQTTINVGPGQTYTTIQSGINAANAGDTVLVAPGTYYENIDFLGKAITVTTLRRQHRPHLIQQIADARAMLG